MEWVEKGLLGYAGGGDEVGHGGDGDAGLYGFQVEVEVEVEVEGSEEGLGGLVI